MQNLDWIYSPVDLTLESFATTRRDLNISYCYRIFHSFTPEDSIDKREDVFSPYSRVSVDAFRRAVKTTVTCCRLFYEGAEEELDRYLAWLSKVYFFTEDDAPAPLYVARQESYVAQEELQMLYPNYDIFFIAPNELEHYGLLVSDLDSVSTEEFF